MATAFQFDAFQNDAFQIDSAVSYTITPSGGVVFSGAVVEQRSRAYVVSGGITFSGVLELIRSKLYDVSGNVSFSGTAPITFGSSGNFVITPSGGITFSGASEQTRTRQYTPLGGIDFTGDVPLIKTKIISASGTLTFSGTVSMQFTSGAGGATTTKLTLTFAGKT